MREHACQNLEGDVNTYVEGDPGNNSIAFFNKLFSMPANYSTQ
jgi:hypothetical protein